MDRITIRRLVASSVAAAVFGLVRWGLAPAEPIAPLSKPQRSEPVPMGLGIPERAPARADEDPRALAAEVAAIDRVREALRRKDTARALAELAQYERSFPVAWLAPEALYLRMETHLLHGDERLARSVAERLLRAYPKSPQAARARVVLSRSNP
jgi:TolA-binding protein